MSLWLQYELKILYYLYDHMSMCVRFNATSTRTGRETRQWCNGGDEKLGFRKET